MGDELSLKACIYIFFSQSSFLLSLSLSLEAIFLSLNFHFLVYKPLSNKLGKQTLKKKSPAEKRINKKNSVNKRLEKSPASKN